MRPGLVNKDLTGCITLMQAFLITIAVVCAIAPILLPGGPMHCCAPFLLLSKIHHDKARNIYVNVKDPLMAYWQKILHRPSSCSTPQASTYNPVGPTHE
jgi:hypothetical protein